MRILLLHCQSPDGGMVKKVTGMCFFRAESKNGCWADICWRFRIERLGGGVCLSGHVWNAETSALESLYLEQNRQHIPTDTKRNNSSLEELQLFVHPKIGDSVAISKKSNFDLKGQLTPKPHRPSPRL
jgi:hypothetical protein